MGDYILTHTGQEVNDFISMRESANTLNVNSNLTNVRGIFKHPDYDTVNFYTDDGYASGIMAKSLYLGEGYGNYYNSFRFHCDGPSYFDGDMRYTGTRLALGQNADPYMDGLIASYDPNVSGVTGTIKITLPIIPGGCVMQIMEVFVFDYSGQSGSQLIISGYTFTDGRWYNYHCRTVGAYSNGCRMANDGSHMCILLGSTSTGWSYPKVWMTRYMAAYTDRAQIYANGKPTISVITSESGYTITGAAT